MNTGRETIADRLQGIPRSRVPKTIRIRNIPQTTDECAKVLADFSFPLLVRMSGTHGGERFEKLHDVASVAAFMQRAPDAEYYVIEYVAYESPDGYFRKYRLIFVDDQIFPYHLAISDQWKVHHFRTDMANQAWMRKEEEAFVHDPGTVLGPEHWTALRQIQRTVGLDYFGVDCGLDQAGDMVVFEVNATMLVHSESSIFAYKQPYIARIKRAFDDMLARKAARPAAA
jgi:carbamoylphosphate synthase large subunit